MGGRTLLLVGIVAAVAVIAFACSHRKAAVDDDSPDGPPSGNAPYTGEELARKIQAAIDAKGAYTLAVKQENLVLPQWGGSDGGTVTVGRDGDKTVAVANLHRTGDGDYTIWLRNGQTYFKRSTCTAMARVSGGGGDVLAPFVLVGNKRIESASKLKAATGRTVLMMEMEGWGPVEIGFEPQTFLPKTVSALNATKNGKALLWEFGDWETQPKVTPPASEFDKAYDRGPGGNPC